MQKIGSVKSSMKTQYWKDVF